MVFDKVNKRVQIIKESRKPEYSRQEIISSKNNPRKT